MCNDSMLGWDLQEGWASFQQTYWAVWKAKIKIVWDVQIDCKGRERKDNIRKFKKYYNWVIKVIRWKS